MKKGLAFLLALTLVFQLATPAFAETLPDETEETTAVETMETEPLATEALPTEAPTVEATTETAAPTETTFAPTEATSATEEPSEETEATEPTYVLTEDSDVIASGTCGADGDNLTWVLTGDGTLTISGSGEMKNYMSKKLGGAFRTTAPWRTYWKQITTVVMEPGVTSIGRDAFHGCSSLMSVTIPEGVTSIGSAAFYGCSGLTSVTIPEGVTSIADWTFRGCSSLTSVTIPESVTSIGNDAFCDCSSLMSVTIPEDVTSIGGGAFNGCSSLSDITVASGNAKYASVDGVLFNKECTTLLRYPAGHDSAVYQISEGVTSIDNGAFYGCSGLTSVTIPEGVTSIADWTFCGCSSLTSVTIPESVTSIDNVAFCGCSSLTSVTIPEGVTSIGSYAFEACSSLTSVAIPESVTSIGEYDFFGCSSLTSVTIPESVTSIGEGAFADCSSLKDVYYAGNQKKWNSIRIRPNNGPLLNATIHLNSGPILTSTSPANGETDVSLDSPLVLTFSRDISDKLNWDKGKIYIRNYETDDLAIAIDEDAFIAIGGKVEGNQMVLPIDFHSTRFCSSYSGKFYILADSGVVCAAETPENGAAEWEGIAQKDTVAFSLDRNIISSGFQVGENTFSFNNKARYFGDYFNIRLLSEHELRLMSKLSPLEKLILYSGGIGSNLSISFTGNCFGMSALMGLFHANRLSLHKMQSDAQDAFDVDYPKDNAYVRSYLSYYQLLQYVIMPEFWEKANKEEQSKKLVNALLAGETPVMLSVTVADGDGSKIITGQHEILAYAVDEDISPEYYVVYAADPNGLMKFHMPDGIHTGTEQLEMFPGYITLFISKKDFEYVGAVLPSSNENVGPGYLVSIDYALNDLSIFDDYSIQSGRTYASRMMSSLLGTQSRNFSFINVKTGEEVVVEDGRIVKGSELSGPYSTAWGDDPSGMNYYHFDSEDEWKFVSHDGEKQSTIVGFAQTDRAMLAETDAGSILFTQNGKIELSEAKSESKVYITPGTSALEDIAISVSANTEDLSFALNSTGSYKVESSENLGKITIARVIGLEETEEKTEIIQSEEVAFAADKDNGIEIFQAPDAVSLSREYVVLSVNSEAMQLQVIPSYVSEAIAWSAENPDGVQVIEVSKDGSVTPLNPGTAYVLATLNTDEKTLTARCRVDVTEKPANEEVLGVDLGLTKVTSELYSRNYASLDVLLRLKQNEISTFAEENQVTDNGVAITGAFLEGEDARQVFDLKVKDDRHLLLVPTQAAIDGAVPVSKKMTSRVVVEVNGVEYHTEDAVTVSVGKTLPKLKAQNVTFNSFYTDQSQALGITGGTVTKVENNGQWPEWLTLDGTKLTLNNAPAKGSASLNLLVSTEEWAVPVPVKVTAKLACKAPAFRLSASRVTIPVFTKPDDNGDTAGTVWVQLLCKRKTDTLEALNVVGIRAPEGWSTEAEWDSAADGWFALKPNPGTQVQAEKITLNVCFSDTKATVPLTVSVKPQATPLTVSLYQPTVKYTLNATVADGFFEPWYLGSRYMNNCQPTWSILDKAGQDVTDNFETYLADDGRIAVLTDPATVVPGNYRLCIDLERDGAIITEKTAVRNFTVLPATKKPSVTLKAGAPMDISFPDPQTDVTFSRSNYFLNRFENYNELEDQAEFYDAKGNALQGCFQFARDEETNRWYIRPVSEVPAGSYQMKLNLILDSGSENGEVLCTVKFTVKRTPIKLKLSQSKLSLNKAVMDSAVVDVNCKTKGYTMGQPVITAPEEITAEYREGKLYLAVNDQTTYGASYVVTVKAAENQPEAVLAVTIPAQAASNVMVSAKASGFIDVIRDSSEIVVTPNYKNYWGLTAIDKTARIFWAKDGKNFTEDVTATFRLSWDESGRLHLQRAGNLELTGKYRLELAVQGAQKPALVNLTLKSGGAKVTAAPVVLYAKDANTRAELKFANQETGLNPIFRVEVRSGEYTIENLSYGGFAIHPIPGKTLKSGKVSLNLFFEGNTTAKPNATVNLSVEIR